MDIGQIPGLEQLVHRYQAELSSLSNRQKAVIEQDIWFLLGPYKRKEMDRRKTLSLILGGSHQDYEQRFILLNAGEAGAPFWSRLDSGEMSLYTAVRLYREAKSRAHRSRTGLPEAVIYVLAEYDALPVSYLPGGGFVRKKTAKKIPRPVTPPPRKPVTESSKAFFVAVRQLASDYLAMRLKGLDEIVAEKLWREFEAELNALLEEFAKKVYRTNLAERRIHEAETEVNRPLIVKACRILCMDPPRPGAPIDRAHAKKNKAKLVRLYHPDAHGGDESMRPQYEAVLEAWSVVERYVEQHGDENKEKRNGERNVAAR